MNKGIEVGKKRNKDEDIVETFAHELRYPATTDAKRLYVTATPQIYGDMAKATNLRRIALPGFSHPASIRV